MLMEFLKGKWLKHPLHSICAHIPAGLWPAALLFDALSETDAGGRPLVQLSFYCLAFGLLASLVAVPTGLVDWSSIKKEKPAWKLGLYHMAVNLLAFVVCAINLGVRASTFQEAVSVGRLPLILSAITALLVVVSAYLGGLMTYDHGVSVARFSKHKWRRAAEHGGANLAPEKGGQR